MNRTISLLLAGTALAAAAASAPLHQEGKLIAHNVKTQPTPLKAQSAPSRIIDISGNADWAWKNVLSASMSTLTEGSADTPVAIETEDIYGSVSGTIFGCPSSYVFVVQGAYQAGGQLMLSPVYDEDWDEYSAAIFSTPSFYGNLGYKIEFKVKKAFPTETGTASLVLVNEEYNDGIDGDEITLTDQWQQVSLESTAQTNEYIDADTYYYYQIASEEASILIKDLEISVYTTPISAPKTLAYTDFTDNSFVANWTAVEGATGYYLTVAEYDEEAEDLVEPYICDDVLTASTSYTVKGITPGNKYVYVVQATDGRNVSPVSNNQWVEALAVPSNVKATADADNLGFTIQWDAVTAANEYRVSVMAAHKATGTETVTIVNADFSSVESTATMDDPEVIDAESIQIDQLPDWNIFFPIKAEGMIGIRYDVLADFFYGKSMKFESEDYDLASAEGRKVTMTLDAASNYASTFRAYLVSYNESTQSYGPVSEYESESLSTDFKHFEIPFTGASSRCYFVIFVNPAADNEDMEADLWLRTLKVTCTLADGSEIALPFASHSTSECSAHFSADLNGGDTYSAAVRAYQMQDQATRLKSVFSETVTVGQSAINDASIDAASISIVNGTVVAPGATRVEVYTADGKRVSANGIARGSLYIVVADGVARKIAY